MRGKRICNTLKKVRLDIAKANGIKLDIPECTHKGECLGTCPRCEWEVKYLERELEKRRKSGAKVALAGISAGLVAVNAVSCGPITTLKGDMAFDDSNGASLTERTESDGQISQPTGDQTTDTAELDGGIEPLMGEPVAETEPDTESIGEVYEDTDTLKGAVPVTEELWLDGDVAFVPETDTDIVTTMGDVVLTPDQDENMDIAGIMPAPEDPADE